MKIFRIMVHVHVYADNTKANHVSYTNPDKLKCQALNICQSTWAYIDCISGTLEIHSLDCLWPCRIRNEANCQKEHLDDVNDYDYE